VVGNLKGVGDGLEKWKKKKEGGEEEQRENTNREERERRSCIVVLKNCIGFKVEMSKLPMVSVLCQKFCLQLSFLINIIPSEMAGLFVSIQKTINVLIS